MEEKKYPIGGYAPGNYHCNCCICGSFFHGDKRAVQCEPCAVAEKALFDALSPDEQATIIANNVAAARAMFSKWDKPGLPPLPEPILTDKDVRDREGEKDEQYVKATDTVTITMTNMNHPLAKKMAVWVKASVKLPPNPDDPNNHYRLKGHRVTGNFYEDTDKMVCFEVRGTTHGAYSISSKLFHYLEWLDESGTATIEWDSIRLIGRVKERFKELEEKQHDWRSFYIGWLEGRVDMLQQIKGYGRLSQECADFIREANNRDLEGVAGREEDLTEDDIVFLNQCSIYIVSGGLQVMTENDEGGVIEREEVGRLVDILNRYETKQQKEK